MLWRCLGGVASGHCGFDARCDVAACRSASGHCGFDARTFEKIETLPKLLPNDKNAIFKDR